MVEYGFGLPGKPAVRRETLQLLARKLDLKSVRAEIIEGARKAVEGPYSGLTESAVGTTAEQFVVRRLAALKDDKLWERKADEELAHLVFTFSRKVKEKALKGAISDAELKALFAEHKEAYLKDLVERAHSMAHYHASKIYPFIHLARLSSANWALENELSRIKLSEQLSAEKLEEAEKERKRLLDALEDHRYSIELLKQQLSEKEADFVEAKEVNQRLLDSVTELANRLEELKELNRHYRLKLYDKIRERDEELSAVKEELERAEKRRRKPRKLKINLVGGGRGGGLRGGGGGGSRGGGGGGGGRESGGESGTAPSPAPQSKPPEEGEESKKQFKAEKKPGISWVASQGFGGRNTNTKWLLIAAAVAVAVFILLSIFGGF
ncbi:MAG: hypothetical protein ACP5IG_00850 [Candidatus Micrarchaeia archaeon]